MKRAIKVFIFRKRSLSEKDSINESLVGKIYYRPFDKKLVYYDTKIIERAREKLMKHLIANKNLGLVFRKQQPEALDLYIFCSDNIIADGYICSDNKGGESIAPLYAYPDNYNQQTLNGNSEITPNLNPVIVKQIADGLGLTFTDEKETESVVCFANSDEVRPEFRQSFAPIDLLDYIYAVLHSPTYREKYKKFLKIDILHVSLPTRSKWLKDHKCRELGFEDILH